MQHPDEGTIHAWLDGALPLDKATAIETHTSECVECAERVAEARGLIAASSRVVSALDWVPPGVVPASRGKARPWYSRSEVRAAAAVLIVAGASFALLQGGDAPVLERVAGSPASVIEDEAVALEAPPSSKTETPASPAAEKTDAVTANRAASERLKAERRVDRVADGQMGAAAAAPATPPPATSAPVFAAADSGNAATAELPKLSAVVVTGAATVAEAASSSSLRVLDADTAGTTRITRYEVSPGVVVTLVERPAPQPVPQNLLRQRRDAARVQGATTSAATPAPPPPPPPLEQKREHADAAVAFPVLSITWTNDSTKSTFVLSGRVPREKLEELRRLIEASRR